MRRWGIASLSVCSLWVSACGSTTRDPATTGSGGLESTGGVSDTGGAPATGGSFATGGSSTSGASSATGGSTGGVVGGGGTLAESEPNFRHGSRLYAQTLLFPGTAPMFVGIYDQLRKTECEFRATPDGKLRCLPADSISAADPATVAPLDQWQEGVEVHGDAPLGRLLRNEIHSTDGGQFPNWIAGEYYDPGFAQPCSANTSQQKDGTGEGLCLPRYAPFTGIFFADSACSVPLANSDLGTTPVLISSPEREVFALGDAYEGQAFVSYANGGLCDKFPQGSSLFFRIGEALAAGVLAAIQQVPRGDGRLALQMIESEGRTVAPVRHRALSSPATSTSGPYFDRDLGRLCQPAWTVRGEVRCLPSDAYFTSEISLTNFADPKCTEPVTYIKSEFAVMTRSEAPRRRGAVVSVRRVGDTPTPTGYWIQNGVCQESLRASGYPFLEEVPLETYALVNPQMGY